MKFGRIAKFWQVAKFPSCDTVHPAGHCSLSCDLLLFDFFLFLPILTLVIAFDFGFFLNLAWLGVVYKLQPHCNQGQLLLINKLGGNFSAFPLLFFFLYFPSIFSPFLTSQTPSKDDNSEDERLEPLSSLEWKGTGQGI